MIKNIKRQIVRHLSNLPGWHTKRKILVFESDDWGSNRMSSINAFKKLKEAGIPVDRGHYNRFDSLECNADLENLFEVLSKFSDQNGNHPAITGVCVVANPDFEKIRDADFQQYFYEPFTQTLNRYPEHDRVIDLWKEGANNRIFVPQFHGREHLYVQRWMRDLKAGNPHTRLAFEHQLWGITSDKISKGYQAAFDLDVPEDLDYLETVLTEGIDLFEQLMGYKPVFFVPTNGPFNLALEKTIHLCGIRYIMLDKLQKEPLGNGKYKTHIRWLGKKNRYGQIALSRNGEFEPSAGGKDWVDSCMSDIEFAFKMKKPATISTHRVNYTGFLDVENRNRNLKLLDNLLVRIQKKWPDVEFFTSPELGDLIRNDKS